jgi:Kef-type K+ transport system membrane component KefB
MSEGFLTFILALSMIIALAKLGGYLSARARQPAVLGELLVGILLGPTLVNLLHIPPFDGHPELAESITWMAEIGVILLMFLAGLELELSELLKSGRVAALAGTLGVVVPLGLGWGTSLLFGYTGYEPLFIGLALSATSVSISAQTLMELKVLRSRTGLALLGAAVFDDILVILLLSIFAILAGAGGAGNGGILQTILLMAGYFAGAVAAGWFLPRLFNLVNKLHVSQGLAAFALVACLAFAWAAEVIGGVAAITGAFIAGIFLARSPHARQIEHGVSALAYSFFVPIFFVNIGLESNLRAISGSAWVFALVITAVAILSKIAGSGLGALAGGFSRDDALRLGIGMVSRGEVGLIVANFAAAQGLLSADGFSITVFMVIIATLVTPPLLRASYARQPATAGEQLELNNEQ